MASLTPRITVVTAGHLATCPRMLKAADALQDAGYAVRVVSARHTPWATAADCAVRASRQWSWTVVDYQRSSAQARQVATGVRFRLARAAARSIGADRVPAAVATRAYSRAHDELVRAVAAEPADFVYGGTTGALAAVAEASARLRVPYALDLEDFHSGEAAGGISDALAETIEVRVLADAAFLTAASPMIAEAYARKYGRRPRTIHNTFSRRFSGADDDDRRELRLYWFSQTLGPGRGLDEVVKAAGRAGIAAELHLRARPIPEYLDALRDLQRRAAPRLAIVPHEPGMPDEMVTLAQPYDLGLSCEEPIVPNHRLCLGNKIFTYLAAGVPVLLSGTPAQAALASDLGSAAFQYACGDIDALASILGRLAADAGLRQAGRRAARAAATRRWHWEHPDDRGAFLEQIAGAIH